MTSVTQFRMTRMKLTMSQMAAPGFLSQGRMILVRVFWFNIFSPMAFVSFFVFPFGLHVKSKGWCWNCILTDVQHFLLHKRPTLSLGSVSGKAPLLLPTVRMHFILHELGLPWLLLTAHQILLSIPSSSSSAPQRTQLLKPSRSYYRFAQKPLTGPDVKGIKSSP